MGLQTSGGVVGWVLWVVVVVVGCAAYGLYTAHVAKQRREEFVAFAASHGWSWAPADYALIGRWSGAPFNAGDRNFRARNVLTGQFHGRPMVAFDYSYQTVHRSGKGRTSTRTHHFGVVVMQLPGALPQLEVTHEHIFSSFANALGFQDIQFESEQFNRNFRVKADDVRYGHAVITPRMMELLLARGEIGWRIEGNSLIGWDEGKHTPYEVMNRLHLLHQVIDQIPAYIWRDYAGLQS